VIKRQLFISIFALFIFSGVSHACNVSALIGSEGNTGTFSNWCVPADSECGSGNICCATTISFYDPINPLVNIHVDSASGGICVSEKHDVNAQTRSTWEGQGTWSQTGTINNTTLGAGGVIDGVTFTSTSCSDGSGTAMDEVSNICDVGERVILYDMDQVLGGLGNDFVYCAVGEEANCCAATSEGGGAGDRCDRLGNLSGASPICCDTEATCFQADEHTFGACRRCALPLPTAVGQSNTVGADCSDDRECCYFQGDTPLTCVNNRCQQNLQVQYCDEGGISKIRAGTVCGFPDGSVDECDNCPGGASQVEERASTDYGGQMMKFCKGIPQGQGTCGGSCHCAPGATSCTSDQKCDVPGSCTTGGTAGSCDTDAATATPDCCNGYNCEAGRCVKDEPAAGTCPTSCDPDNSTCSSDCPCVGSPGRCNSTADGGGGSGGAIPCEGTGCNGDCPNARSCDGGYCSDTATCTPSAVDFSEYGYKGPKLETLTGLLGSIFQVLYALGLGIGIFMIVKNGYELMTSQGEPNAVRVAQENLTAAVLGIIFILLSITILRVIITSLLGGSVSF
jgi:hypothetical protein